MFSETKPFYGAQTCVQRFLAYLLIYINNLRLAVNYTLVKLFADDSNFFGEKCIAIMFQCTEIYKTEDDQESSNPIGNRMLLM